MRARDIMTVNVATVSPEMPVAEIARLLLSRHISGVPVVDAGGRLLGIISEGDLMFRAETGTEHHRSWWRGLLTTAQEAAVEYVREHGTRAGDVMTRDLITVGEDTPAADIAELFAERRIKRVPVLRDGRLVGIVSRADLLRGFLAAQPAATPPVAPSEAADDATIRSHLLEAMRRHDWAAGMHLNPVVADGTVHLWGFVDSAEQRRAVRIVAEAAPGVRSVVDHLVTVPPGMLFYAAT